MDWKTIYPERKDHSVSGLTKLETEMRERLGTLKSALDEAGSNHYRQEGEAVSEATGALREAVRLAINELSALELTIDFEGFARQE